MREVSPAKTTLVRDLLEHHKAELTPAERRLVPFLKDDSLVLELRSITNLAEAANVSTPTVIRLARKLGFGGFPSLHNAIREELAERIKKPLAKLKVQASASPEDHLVNGFAHQVMRNLNGTISQLDHDVFDDVANLLSDWGNKLYLTGGRITRSNADYFFNHLQIIRPNVTLLGASPSVWPQSVLDMDQTSVLIIIDIRRYEKELEKLAGLAESQGARIILFTDQWGSPIEKLSHRCFRTMVEAPSSWDSTIAINFLIETMIAQIQKLTPKRSSERIREMEKVIGVTNIFRGS